MQTYASLGALVTPFVEIGKEAEEEDAVTADPPDKSLGIVAVDKEELERVDDDGDKLNLKAREKSFTRFSYENDKINIFTIWKAVRYFFHQINF